jgi:hypothetical protein
MAWTYKFTPDDAGSLKGVATVTLVDEDVFSETPFVFSHRVALDAKIDDVSRLKVEIEEALAKEAGRRVASATDSTALATLLALE